MQACPLSTDDFFSSPPLVVLKKRLCCPPVETASQISEATAADRRYSH
jgi:hypothetical protein